MRLRGREIDVISLWSQYVEFPPNTTETDQYLPLVVCPNPEHDTHKRHFQINARDGLVHCFANCGISGTFAKAISLIEGCNEKEAGKIILTHKAIRQANGRNSRNRFTRPEPVEIVPDRYSSYLPQFGLEYLEERGINAASIAAWNLAWDDEELRIVIPAKDLNGVTRFNIKRAVRPNDYPKYLYEPQGVHKNSLLFGACQTDPRMVRSQGIILVEGSVDAIRLHQHGFSTAVATLGTGISEIQCRVLARLRPRKVFMLFDRDIAGVHGIDIARRRLGKYPLYVARYPRGKYDPAELGRREVERSIERAIPLSRFMAKVVA